MSEEQAQVQAQARTPVAAGAEDDQKLNGQNALIVEEEPDRTSAVDAGTDSTEQHVPKKNNLMVLSNRLQHLSVSPPRRREEEEGGVTSPTTAPATSTLPMRASTPPPVVPPRSSKPATPVDPSGPLGLPRNKSSPSLLDASPKSSSASPKSSVPPPRSSRKQSPRADQIVAGNRAHAHELTPVTRNTDRFVDEPTRGGASVVSPEEELHGEHLTLPSGDDYNSGGIGLQQPPLPQRQAEGKSDPPYLPVPKRSAEMRGSCKSSSMAMNYSVDDEEEEEHGLVGEAVQFPSRKIYSFTSGQKYKEAVEEERGAFFSENQQIQEHLKPYQPSRSDVDVGLAREETSRIFIPRDNAVPLDERQWSIPSIRMANHLQGGSTTDTYTDEEDDLRVYDDDASLSSRGSSLYLPEETATETSFRLGPTTLHHSAPAVVIEDGMDRVFHVNAVPDSSAVAVAQEEEQPPKEERRKKRTKKHNSKEREAYEWLRTLELQPENSHIFAEAASSKFLTSGPQSKPHAKQLPFPLHRTDSSPATISAAAAAASLKKVT